MSHAEHSWVWPALERMADITAQKEQAEKEMKRLEETYAAERARVLEAVPALSVEDAVKTIRLIGSPGATAAAAPSADAASGAAGDPLVIPPYLRRGEASGERTEPTEPAHDASAGAPQSAPAT